MSTSGTTTFTMTALEMIEKAFHRLGKASEGEALTARMYEDGRSSLNLLCKAEGVTDHLWLRTSQTVTLVASQAGYVLSPRPQRVLSVRRRDDDDRDINLLELSRQEYDELPTKAVNESTPTSWYYDPQRTTGTLYLWPVPETSVAADNSVIVTYLRKMDDITASTDELDAPAEWLQPMIWALADDLETEYPVNDARLAGKIEAKAAIFWNKARGGDNETASLLVQPDYEGFVDWR